ncbi:MAG: methionyl-tRNA formyltransferase [Candidatus Omnitrophica bacterium]|nr:methionyl-tRNA formyltransferase [Candidatus Omnitrophota bacterium]
MARIVYIGAERVGRACLEALIGREKNIVGILTADESLRKRIADYIRLDDVAKKYAIPIYKVIRCDDLNVINRIKTLRPELIVMISWSQILPREIIRYPGSGCINIHYSLLPKGRGGAPLFWTIFNGLKKSGITLHYVNERIDAGDIIDQSEFEILPTDTAKTLLDKILKLAPQLLMKHIDSIESGVVLRQKQNESEATCFSARKPSQSLIDWSMSEEEIWRFVRALAPPYPAAFTILGKRRIYFTNAKLIDGKVILESYLE